MTPRYIIHIGPLKTASTYIQMGLTAARDELAALGICYPIEFVNDSNKYMHMPLYRDLVRGNAEKHRATFAKINATGYHTVLLSCEHFVFLSPDAMATLRDLTGAQDFSVVYTCRRWSDRLSSIWNQSILEGSKQSFPECYLSLLAGKPVNYYPKWMRVRDLGGWDIDYSISWRQIDEVFGRGALVIFPYSVITDRGEDVYVRFCTDVLTLEQAPATALTGSTRWTSLVTEDQEVLRMLNYLYLEDNEHENSDIRVQMARRRRKYDASMTIEAMQGYVARLAVDDRAPQFSAAFANMQAYGDRTLGGGALFEPRSKQVRYVEPGYLLRDGVRENLTQVYQSIVADMPAGTSAGKAVKRKAAAAKRRARSEEAE